MKNSRRFTAKHTSQTLDYNSLLTDDLFEKLCLRLFKNEFPSLINHRQIGKKGTNQDGIDLSAFNPETGKYVVLQAKKYQSINPSEIIKIEENFLKGEYNDKTEIFIIGTSCSLTDSNKKESTIREMIERFYRKGIRLIQWDNKGLDLLFKDNIKYSQIVYDFFDGDDEPGTVKDFYGPSILNDISGKIKRTQYCMPKIHIERFLNKVEIKNSEKDFYPDKPLTLIEVLKIRSGTKKIILRSDAGLGKSSELEYVAGYFSKNSKLYLPVFKSLKNYENPKIEEVLDKQINGWKNIDFRNVLLILDGLDELKLDFREGFLKSLKVFSNENPECSILLSCRSNFIQSLPLEDFNIWELAEFDRDNIIKYAQLNLIDAQVEEFLKIVESKDLLNWLKNPFILSIYIEIFKDNPKQLPTNRKELLSQIVENYFLKDVKRGDLLAEKKDILLKCIRTLSLNMNLWGTNILSNEEFVELFPNSDEREVIKKSSLIKSEDGVKFIHNIFQEYFSAIDLSKYDLNQIERIICFEPDFNIIRPKWYNTVSILLDLLDKDEKFDSLLKLIISFQPSLLFTIEYKEIDLKTRFNAFKAIINRPERMYNRELYYTHRLPLFGGICENGDVISLILDKIRDSKENKAKNEYIYLLAAAENKYFGLKNRIVNTLKECIVKDEALIYNATSTLYAIKLINEENLDFIFDIVSKSTTQVNEDLYYRIANDLNLTNSYAKYYIQALESFINNHSNYDKEINNSLIEGLGKMNQYTSLEHLLDFFIKNETKYPYHRVLTDIYEYSYWNYSFRAQKGEGNKNLLSDLISNCKKVYLDNHIFFNKYLEFYNKCNSGEHRILNLLTEFFRFTGTEEIAFYSILNNVNSYIQIKKIALLANKIIIPDIVRKYSQKEIDSDTAGNCIEAFTEKKDETSANKLRNLLNKVGPYNFVKYEKNSNVISQEIIKENDLDLLLDKESFLKKVNEVFYHYQQRELTKLQIFQYKHSCLALDNSIVIGFLGFYLNNEVLNQNDVITFLSHKANWESFVIDSYKNLLEKKEKLKKENILVIQQWCNKIIDSCNFATAIIKTAKNSHSFLYPEHTVYFFFENLDLVLPYNKVIEMLDFDFWSGRGIVNKDISLSDKIVQAVNNDLLVKTHILTNLENLKLLDEVIMSQIVICSKKGFSEAVPGIKVILREKNKFRKILCRKIIENIFCSGGKGRRF